MPTYKQLKEHDRVMKELGLDYFGNPINSKKSRSKKELKVGDNVVFNSGNYAGLTGVIIEIDWDSKHKNAIYGIYHTVQLSNGHIGHIEKSEHWQFA